MSRFLSQPLMSMISNLLRSGGRGRGLGMAMILIVLAALWWRPPPPNTPPADAGRPAPAGRAGGERASARGEAQSPPATAEVRDVPAGRSWDAAGDLRDEGRGVYRSAAGLVYTRGSEQGHRLKHVLTHGQDQPDRPGQHGVFADGRQESIVALIDEAYRQAERNEGTRRQQDRERTLLTVDLRRVIGYIGGQTGNRRGRPTAHHLRLVLEDNRVITAYPVIP